jgi:transposase
VAPPAFKAVCVETRHAQRFPSTRPVKTDRKDARGIAEMLRIGYYRPVQVKSVEAQLIRTSLPARRQIVATLLQVQGTIRGLLRMHGLKVGETPKPVRQSRARAAEGDVNPEYCDRADIARRRPVKGSPPAAAVQRVSDSAEFENHRA